MMRYYRWQTYEDGYDTEWQLIDDKLYICHDNTYFSATIDDDKVAPSAQNGVTPDSCVFYRFKREYDDYGAIIETKYAAIGVNDVEYKLTQSDAPPDFAHDMTHLLPVLGLRGCSFGEFCRVVAENARIAAAAKAVPSLHDIVKTLAEHRDDVAKKQYSIDKKVEQLEYAHRRIAELTRTIEEHERTIAVMRADRDGNYAALRKRFEDALAIISAPIDTDDKK